MENYKKYTSYNEDNLTRSERMNKRLLIVKMTPPMLEKIFVNDGDIRIRTNLPKDSKIVRMDWDYQTDTFDITVESESFEQHSEGSHIPVVWNAIIVESEKNYIDRKVKKLKE